MFDIIIMVIVNAANIASVWLAAKNNRLTWVIGFIAVVITAALFFVNGHYMSFAFNTYSALICILRHFSWKNSVAENDKTVRWGSPYLPLALSIALSVGFYFINRDLSNNAWLDSIGTAISFVAAYLLVRQDVNAWLLYLLSDILYIYLGIISGNTEYIIIYSVMMVLAIYGTREFIVKYKKNEQELSERPSHR